MGLLAGLSGLIYVLFLYMTLNVANTVFYVGLASLALYVALGFTSELSSDTAYSWKDDKRMFVLRGTAMAVFSMSACLYVINNLG